MSVANLAGQLTGRMSAHAVGFATTIDGHDVKTALESPQSALRKNPGYWLCASRRRMHTLRSGQISRGQTRQLSTTR